MDITLQGQYSHIANMLIRQLRTKEITLDEFLMQCAYWGVKTLDDIYFKSIPTRPLEVVDYEGLSYSKKNRLPKEYYEDHPEVMGYYQDKDRIMRENKDNLWRLEAYKEHIPESDLKAHEKLDKRINDFRLKLEG